MYALFHSSTAEVATTAAEATSSAQQQHFGAVFNFTQEGSLELVSGNPALDMPQLGLEQQQQQSAASTITPDSPSQPDEPVDKGKK